MAVNQLATCFRASATAPDDVIECYESNDPTWFCLGVQWHPESDSASALDLQVFQALTEAATSNDGPQILPMPARMAA
jgi:putative glutamine amidotransferase